MIRSPGYPNKQGWYYHNIRVGRAYRCMLNTPCPTPFIKEAVRQLAAEYRDTLPPVLHWVVGSQIWTSQGGYYQWYDD